MNHHANTTIDARRRAFTLTELLIVVTIIVVLISILLPAVGGVRNAARRSSSESLMASIHQSVGQFRAAEQRIPGYFTVKDVGADANKIESPTGGALLNGITYFENALLDLAGGVSEDQSTANPADPSGDPDTPPDRIRVGVGLGPANAVFVERTAVGAEDGPGYLDLPDGFVSWGGVDDGRAGSSPGADWMPRVIDAWGSPLLMWPRDEFAGKDKPMAAEDSDTERAAFYWAGNSAFVCGQGLGRAKANNYAASTLSFDVASAQKRTNSLNAIVGHPQFPDPASITGPNGPLPAEARGDVVLHSAGANGVYLESDNGQFNEYHYIPDGTDFSSSPSWISDTTNYLEKADDVILAGS